MLGLFGFVYLGVSNFISGFHDQPYGIAYVFTSFKSHYWRIFSGVIGSNAELCVWDVRAVVCHPFKKPFFVHYTLLKRRLNAQETQILEQQFPLQ